MLANNYKLYAAFAAVLLLYSTSSLALGDPVTTESQLLGCWKQQMYPAGLMAGVGAEDIYDPVTQKYHWFCFDPKGQFSVITTNTNAPLIIKELKKYAKAYPRLMTWKLLGTGVVSITHKEDPQQNLNWLVSFAPESAAIVPGVPVEKGDMYFGRVNEAQNAYALLRILRKVE
jgi:hypothetical protein